MISDLINSPVKYQATFKSLMKLHEKKAVNQKLRLAVATSCLLSPSGKNGPALRLFRKLQKLRDMSLPNCQLEILIISRINGLDELAIQKDLRDKGLDFQKVLLVQNPIDFLSPLQIDLYLTDNEKDVRQGRIKMLPVAQLMGQPKSIELSECLSFAFDYDMVLADCSAAIMLPDLNSFNRYEDERADIPHKKGVLYTFFIWLFRAKQILEKNNKYDLQQIKLALVTWRSGRSERRLFTSLQSWGVELDEIHLLAGEEKSTILQVIAPDLFIDDSRVHLIEPSKYILCAHIPNCLKESNLLE